jgi:hypothetical protein
MIVDSSWTEEVPGQLIRRGREEGACARRPHHMTIMLLVKAIPISALTGHRTGDRDTLSQVLKPIRNYAKRLEK